MSDSKTKMPKIAFEQGSSGEPGEWNLLLDDKTVDSRAFPTENKWRVYVYAEMAAEPLQDCSFQQLSAFFTGLVWRAAVPGMKHLDWIEVHFRSDKKDLLNFESNPDVETWANPYSVVDLIECLEKASSNDIQGIRFYKEDESPLFGGFGLQCEVRSHESVLREEIRFWLPHVVQIYKSAERAVLGKVRPLSLITLFDFPVQVRASCEQYLLYFGQFLEDLGITAQSEIKEEAGRVLFSVTPDDGEMALGRIKEALEIYLRIPQDPEFGTSSGQFSDIAVAQLRANVFFLQSQLALAQATLQAKDAAIQALDITVFKQRQLLADSTNVSLLQAAAKKETDEPIIGDTVSLKKYEGKFVNVDLPTILRRLKRSFGIGNMKDH